MPVTITRLSPYFAARIDGVDVRRPVDDQAWAEVRATFEERATPFDTTRHKRFMQRTTVSGDPVLAGR